MVMDHPLGVNMVVIRVGGRGRRERQSVLSVMQDETSELIHV
jgi:hypothetical protein